MPLPPGQGNTVAMNWGVRFQKLLDGEHMVTAAAASNSHTVTYLPAQWKMLPAAETAMVKLAAAGLPTVPVM